MDIDISAFAALILGGDADQRKSLVPAEPCHPVKKYAEGRVPSGFADIGFGLRRDEDDDLDPRFSASSIALAIGGIGMAWFSI